jgi:hypothetical protein
MHGDLVTEHQHAPLLVPPANQKHTKAGTCVSQKEYMQATWDLLPQPAATTTVWWIQIVCTAVTVTRPDPSRPKPSPQMQK